MSSTLHVLRRGWPLLLGVILIGAISYVAPGSPELQTDITSGQYALKADEGSEQHLYSGDVYFEYTKEQGGVADFGVFKLHFLSESLEDSPGFGFLIPLSHVEKEIQVKTYEVDPQSRGFMNGLGTVFGYADFKKKPASLYFADTGSLSISDISNGQVSGEIDVVLDNGSGEQIQLEGRFRALPIPSSLAMANRKQDE